MWGHWLATIMLLWVRPYKVNSWFLRHNYCKSTCGRQFLLIVWCHSWGHSTTAYTQKIKFLAALTDESGGENSLCLRLNGCWCSSRVDSQSLTTLQLLTTCTDTSICHNTPCDGYIDRALCALASYPGRLQKKKTAWYPLFAHVRPSPEKPGDPV